MIQAPKKGHEESLKKFRKAYCDKFSSRLVIEIKHKTKPEHGIDILRNSILAVQNWPYILRPQEIGQGAFK